MKAARHPAIAFLLLISAGALAPAALWPRHQKTPEELEARIEREKNPVKKAKLEVQLGSVELQEAVRDYDEHQPARGVKLLGAFSRSMQDSWNVLEGSGRNAAKKPQGFMELEIALREDARTLNDLRQRISYYSRGPVDDALHSLSQLHSKVLLALFPGAAPPAVTKASNSKIQTAHGPRKVAQP